MSYDRKTVEGTMTWNDILSFIKDIWKPILAFTVIWAVLGFIGAGWVGAVLSVLIILSVVAFWMVVLNDRT